jgi:hypothetical protein
VARLNLGLGKKRFRLFGARFRDFTHRPHVSPGNAAQLNDHRLKPVGWCDTD